jgi:hydrogenase accessory protein HypB
MNPRIVDVREGILKKNDLLARDLRARFRQARVFVVSLVSSPGAGKTAFLERTLGLLKETRRVGALVGDLATDNDARRLGRAGVPVRQITTGTVCHLEAQMVQEALEGWDLAALDFLFVENVGNLVCPSSYDLGEDLRVVLMSVTEGEDDLQLRRPRDRHQGGPRRGGGLRPRGGAPQHRGRATRAGSPGDVGADGPGHGPLAGDAADARRRARLSFATRARPAPVSPPTR